MRQFVRREEISTWFKNEKRKDNVSVGSVLDPIPEEKKDQGMFIALGAVALGIGMIILSK